ncbi:hypothetical protein DOTSEDRAFT_68299 [Dothistroma septosporum NZE10]|uniref:C2H2-type domain-containing protein n=1 Tax=Dothistroma septosporum (strain NZE10 / CBS 128990) TaxID=675120 RepID=N1Q1D0_DOTSN|nr:hypothetical protein DOTSEDRAFT_68299 [Dothistroma septosporum NZE10]
MEPYRINTLQSWPLEIDDDTEGFEHRRSPAVYSCVAGRGSLSAESLPRYIDESERVLTSPTDQIDCPTPLSFYSYCAATSVCGHPDLSLQVVRRHPSPASSTLGSSLTSGARSECRESPWTSPQLAVVSHSAHGGYTFYEDYGHHAIGDCVALHDVQRCADDEQFAAPALEETQTPYISYGFVAQEGYHPMPATEDDASQTSRSASCSEYRPTEEPRRRSSQLPDLRRRRIHTSRPISSSTSRVNKRPQIGQRASSSHHGTKIGTVGQRGITTASPRAFPCPLAVYGCLSSFGSKNEWKRHVSTQHMRLGFWRCDQCTEANSERKPNDFNRKDLFIQHVRRMHTADISRASTSKRSLAKSRKDNEDDHIMDLTAKRCYHHLRSSPEQSGCLFCERRFHGSGSWNERMEHIGRHMESERKSKSPPTNPWEWNRDDMAHEWMLEEGIVVSRGAQWLIT